MPRTAHRRARRTLQAIVVIALWGLITHGTFAGSGDEAHYLAIAHSIAFDGDFDLANNYGAAEPLIAGGHLQPEAHIRTGVGGVVRPVHDVGLPLLFAPYVRVAVPVTRFLSRTIPAPALQRARLNAPVLYRHLLSLAMIGLSALLAGLLFDSLLAIGATGAAARAVSLVVMLSPPLLIMSSLFFTELMTALLCFAVFRRLMLVDTSGPRAWVLLGGAIGMLFLIHARNIGLVVPLAGLAAYRLRGRSWAERGGFAIALLLVVAVRTWINYEFWGTLLQSPHARVAWIGGGELIQQMAMRLTALLVDQEFGLLPYAPIYASAIVGAFLLARVRPELTLAITLVIVVYVGLIVCPITNVHGWTGGWSPAARFLTPILPLIALWVYAGLRDAPPIIVAPILALQIVISAYAWQHPKVLWNDGNGVAAYCETRAAPWMRSTQARICAWLPSFPGP